MSRAASNLSNTKTTYNLRRIDSFQPSPTVWKDPFFHQNSSFSPSHTNLSCNLEKNYCSALSPHSAAQCNICGISLHFDLLSCHWRILRSKYSHSDRQRTNECKMHESNHCKILVVCLNSSPAVNTVSNHPSSTKHFSHGIGGSETFSGMLVIAKGFHCK